MNKEFIKLINNNHKVNLNILDKNSNLKNYDNRLKVEVGDYVTVKVILSKLSDLPLSSSSKKIKLHYSGCVLTLHRPKSKNAVIKIFNKDYGYSIRLFLFSDTLEDFKIIQSHKKYFSILRNNLNFLTKINITTKKKKLLHA